VFFDDDASSEADAAGGTSGACGASCSGGTYAVGIGCEGRGDEFVEATAASTATTTVGCAGITGTTPTDTAYASGVAWGGARATTWGATTHH
jgi:hypothetical protein